MRTKARKPGTERTNSRTNGAKANGRNIFAAVAEAEEVDEALALIPAESPIGVRIKYVAAISRLPERGGRLAARQSADRAGLVASLERDKASMTVTYLPQIAYV